MSYKDIRHAQRVVWPEVEKSMRRQDAARLVVQRRPELHTSSARRRARTPRDEVIAQETIWALAKNDLLLTPATQKVIQVARRWLAIVAADVESFPEDFEPIDVELRDALAELALDIRPDEDEDLPDGVLSATVSQNTH